MMRRNERWMSSFRGGDTYRYMHVPEFVYRELLKAESAGVFWNSMKDQFEYVKLE